MRWPEKQKASFTALFRSRNLTVVRAVNKAMDHTFSDISQGIIVVVGQGILLVLVLDRAMWSRLRGIEQAVRGRDKRRVRARGDST